MALNGLICAEVPLRNRSLTYSLKYYHHHHHYFRRIFGLLFNWSAEGCIKKKL